MLAPSTIAMSAYNLLTLAPDPPTAGQIYSAVCRGHAGEVKDESEVIPREAFIEALRGLLRRKFVAVFQEKDKEDRFVLVDPRRRRVRWRDRTGDGWNNWLVEDPRGPQKLEDVINGIQ
jgi:CRISPR/Cas system endoribonuclease Cas6 (RAMP superfamily)